MKNKFDSWFVYIVECSDKTLYTGITTNIERRIIEHNLTKKGASYTRVRRPVMLVAHACVKSRSEATKAEIKIKKLKRSEKINYLLSIGGISESKYQINNDQIIPEKER